MRLARLGLEVTFVGRVGDDYYGRWAVEQLRADGVNTSGMVIDPGLRTGATVVLSTGAERAFATYLGSITEIRRSDITPEILAGADHLHVGSYFLQRRLHPEMLDLLQEARRRGLTTSVDPGWDNFMEWDAGILDVLPFVDVFLPNLVEARQITGAGLGRGGAGGPGAAREDRGRQDGRRGLPGALRGDCASTRRPSKFRWST